MHTVQVVAHARNSFTVGTFVRLSPAVATAKHWLVTMIAFLYCEIAVTSVGI